MNSDRMQKLKTRFQESFEKLPEDLRESSKGLLTWEQVLAAISDKSIFWEAVARLDQPEVYWINEDDELVVGDAGLQPPKSTLDRTYFQCREDAAAIPHGGLIRFEEYGKLKASQNFGHQFDMNHYIWVESGDQPPKAKQAHGGLVIYETECEPELNSGMVGARRVLRWPLLV